jgi:hypothetical protein
MVKWEMLDHRQVVVLLELMELVVVVEVVVALQIPTMAHQAAVVVVVLL